MVTRFVKPEEVERRWYVIDATDQVLGRLACRIVALLRGKGKVGYSPDRDLGDFVVVVNAEKVRLTGKKAAQKTYFRHSGYPGHWRNVGFAEMIQKHPERVLERAVWGMLPKNRLGRRMMRKLKVYRGPEHPHQAQKPEPLVVE